MTAKVELVNIRGATSIFIDAEITESGDFQVSGQDVGDAPREFYGDSDYEYWLIVRAPHKAALYTALLEKRFPRDAEIVSIKRQTWVQDSATEQDEELLSIVEDSYQGNDRVVSELMAYLNARGIPREFSSY